LDYAKLAEDNAFIAEALDPKETETAVALAYAYACKEMGVSNKALTQSKVRELTADHLDNLEVQYLAWVVDPGGNASFVKKLEGERSPRLQHVLDVERAYAVKAASASDPKEKQDQLNRANEWLSKAQALYPGNPVVLFRRGYVSQLSQRMAEARDYYVRAIAGQTDFPRARDNLGTIYAHERAWNEAKSQFEAAAATQDAPVQARAASLRNLGAVYLELDPTIGFKSMCDVWQKANQLVVPEQTAEGSTHSALCDFPEDPKKACREYQAAVRLGDEHGWNLRQISTFREEWSVGPEEGKLLETLLGSCGV
jgi:tetratricopeptide (TPR) repeat protein